MISELRGRVTRAAQKWVANPLMRMRLSQTLLETTGRKSGLPRTTPLGGQLDGNRFWLVSEFGEQSQYIRNITANPRVRLRLHGTWREGTAHLLPGDDPRARLRQLPKWNSLIVRRAGTNLFTVRIDLDD
jgi:deazaflavin-dependent oxidoreductase (nitroreductase family)